MSTNLNLGQARWISQSEAARIRGVTRQAISRLIKRGRLKTLVIAGHVLVSRRSLLRFSAKKRGRRKKTRGLG